MKYACTSCLIFWGWVQGSLLSRCARTNTHADNMATCEKYFAYCGAGIYIPIQHIRLGDKEALEESYLTDKVPMKDTKNGRGEGRETKIY